MEGRVRYIWWGILGLFFVGAAFRFLLPVHSLVEFEQNEENSEIVVYITGAVKNEGLLSLPLDARLDDALKTAVLSEEADLEVLNPAQKLKDGQKIIVPYKLSELETAGQSAANNKMPSTSSGKIADSSLGKVNINTAGAAELDTIPGIGPVLAQRIIDYRLQNGLFSSPEDIMNVSGIGSKTFEKMAEYIRVGP